MDKESLISELNFKAVRSSGSGGQNVNKVATKVELYFDLSQTTQFTEAQKEMIMTSLQGRINSDGILMLSCGESRSQWQNKKRITQRFFDLIEEALKEQKPRVPTKIPKSVKKKRQENKRILSERKAHRKPPEID